MSMKNYIKVLFVLLLFCEQNLMAQNANYYGSKEEDIANSIVLFEDNYYILGTTRKTDKISTDFYIVELFANGKIKNKFTFGGKYRDTGKDIKVNKDGIYVFGKRWEGGYTNNDMFLTKLDFEGNEQWKRFYGGYHNDLGHKFIFTKDGGFAMAGFNRSVDDFGDAYLVKADKNGELIWENHFGDRYVDHAFDVVETDEGNFIVVGTKGGFYNPTSTDFLNHDADIYIIKTNAEGKKLWEKTYGGTGHDWAKEIIKAPGGGYFVCGSTQSSGAGSFDFFLMKIDEDGNELWFKTYGGKDFDYGESVRISKDNNLYIIGSSASYSDNYKPDHLLVKTNLNGEIIWSNTYGGDDSDYSSALVCTKDSGCVFTGWTKNGDIGKTDIVLYKISKNGETLIISNITSTDSVISASIYPNPATNKFTVELFAPYKTPVLFYLYDINGKEIFTKTLSTNSKTEIEHGNNSGTYIYRIEQDGKFIYSGKLIIKN